VRFARDDLWLVLEGVAFFGSTVTFSDPEAAARCASAEPVEARSAKEVSPPAYGGKVAP